jgi:hypothetical protein
MEDMKDEKSKCLKYVIYSVWHLSEEISLTVGKENVRDK